MHRESQLLRALVAAARTVASGEQAASRLLYTDLPSLQPLRQAWEIKAPLPASPSKTVRGLHTTAAAAYSWLPTEAYALQHAHAASTAAAAADRRGSGNEPNWLPPGLGLDPGGSGGGGGGTRSLPRFSPYPAATQPPDASPERLTAATARAGNPQAPCAAAAAAPAPQPVSPAPPPPAPQHRPRPRPLPPPAAAAPRKHPHPHQPPPPPQQQPQDVPVSEALALLQNLSAAQRSRGGGGRRGPALGADAASAIEDLAARVALRPSSGRGAAEDDVAPSDLVGLLCCCAQLGVNPQRGEFVSRVADALDQEALQQLGCGKTAALLHSLARLRGAAVQRLAPSQRQQQQQQQRGRAQYRHQGRHQGQHHRLGHEQQQGGRQRQQQPMREWASGGDSSSRGSGGGGRLAPPTALDTAPAALLRRLCVRAQELVPEMDERHLPRLLWSLGQLKTAPPRLVTAALVRLADLEKESRVLSPAMLSMLLDGAARLPGGPWHVRFASSALQREAAGFSPGQVARAVWALGQLGCNPEPGWAVSALLRALQPEAEVVAQHLSSKEVTHLLWGLADLHHDAPLPLLDACAAVLADRMHEVDGRSASRNLLSLAKLRYLPRDTRWLVPGLEASLRQDAASLGDEGVASALWASFELQLPLSRATLSVLGQRLLSLLTPSSGSGSSPSCSVRASCVALWSLAGMAAIGPNPSDSGGSGGSCDRGISGGDSSSGVKAFGSSSSDGGAQRYVDKRLFGALVQRVASAVSPPATTDERPPRHLHPRHYQPDHQPDRHQQQQQPYRLSAAEAGQLLMAELLLRRSGCGARLLPTRGSWPDWYRAAAAAAEPEARGRVGQGVPGEWFTAVRLDVVRLLTAHASTNFSGPTNAGGSDRDLPRLPVPVDLWTRLPSNGTKVGVLMEAGRQHTRYRPQPARQDSGAGGGAGGSGGSQLLGSALARRAALAGIGWVPLPMHAGRYMQLMRVYAPDERKLRLLAQACEDARVDLGLGFALKRGYLPAAGSADGNDYDDNVYGSSAYGDDRGAAAAADVGDCGGHSGWGKTLEE